MILPGPLTNSFREEARRLAACRIVSRAGALSGYGARGEVIYERHPRGCPSVLVDSREGAVATFMSNGATGFTVRAPEFDVEVLRPHFDQVEKQESGVPAANVWLVPRAAAGAPAAIVSLHNACASPFTRPRRLRIVKTDTPHRAMWFLAAYDPGGGLAFRTALRLALVTTPAGPALLRQALVENTGGQALGGMLWTWWNLRGTQEFVYNKGIWYDAGMPVRAGESVVAARVPFRDMLQIKRVSSVRGPGLSHVASTCDHLSFVGDTASSALLPDAVRRGRLLPGGAGARLNRFSTPTGAADGFRLRLAPGAAAELTQALLYVTDEAAVARFRAACAARRPRYRDLAAAFARGAADLVARTPGADAVAERLAAGMAAAAGRHPFFRVGLPAAPAAAHYVNSVWTGVAELYENCRAHGARLADGIELGTRDRGQDMWPMIRQDPGRVRADLVHALGFMYRTVDDPIPPGRRLTLRQKLHGMFPRQYPSRWDDRSRAIANDNRPYADSPLWLLDALVRYIRETGDRGILAARTTTAALVDPDNPAASAMRGGAGTLAVRDVARETLACFARHCADSPYGMAQIVHGDWCDPVDMLGTGRVGDAATRGEGRGTSTRLSAHLFLVAVAMADLLDELGEGGTAFCRRLRRMADRLRRNVVRVAWEPGPHAGFVDGFHELRADGSRPLHARGETGYALGSMRREREFDGIPRRVLVAQAWGLAMLTADRPWLTPVAERDAMVRDLLRTVDRLFHHPSLGLRLYTTPIGNNEQACRLVGRMGILPSGCAENGEYHHAQLMMHLVRLRLPGQAGTVWRQFRPVMSAFRDATLNGPFEMPCTSCAADSDDPHFGAGMYFGLSGSTDWIVDLFEEMAGVRTALHDPSQPAVRVTPRLPAALRGAMTYARTLHVARPEGGYREVPLTVNIRPCPPGRPPSFRINGRPATAGEVRSLDGLAALHIEATIAPAAISGP